MPCHGSPDHMDTSLQDLLFTYNTIGNRLEEMKKDPDTQSQAYRIQYKWDAISAMPTNLYGPSDNFHPENECVLPTLMRRFHDAKLSGDKEVVVWGPGSSMREFLHVNDLAYLVSFLLEKYSIWVMLMWEWEGGSH
ncbi:putative GDP-L-fucose synthase [Helianthus annuus]|nr:putative GDP-L-fucose synthase [Helianthus annuus]